jgi:hypothetical protein
MGLWLKQSTAVDFLAGPFVDDTDGKTAETGLTITSAEVRLSKNGGNMAAKNEATALVHDELGMYVCKLNTTDTNTLGTLQVTIWESGALIVYHEFMVVTANEWDSICSTDYKEVDLIQMGGVTQSGTDLKDFADAGYDPATNKVQGLVLCDLTTTTTTATAATDVTNDVGITQAGADKVWGTAARALTDKAGFALSAAAIDAVWDEVMDGNAPANADTARKIVNIIAAVLGGKSSGGGTATNVYRDTGDTKDRISATVDANGNRTAVGTIDGA